MKKKTALALGAFDGLHKGHIKVLNQAINNENLISGVVTFNENPTKILKNSTEYLLSEDDKEEILKEIGIKNIYKLDFAKVKDISPEDFFHDILLKKLGAKVLTCGDNFRFGKKALGDVKLLKKLCDENNITLKVVSPFEIDGEIVSSTRIRTAVKNGDMITATKLLGRHFGFSFEVVTGNKIGRTLGTPTINQNFPQGFVIPKYGVYASIVHINGTKYAGVTNIGVKPSIGKYDPLSETWIPNIDMDLYGMKIKVEILEFIREEKKFENLDKLKSEIFKNGEKAKEICSKYW
ncbi:MAG: bifunctional riboflavin kinase/FAD synthetase [Clostridia bacterium]